MGGTEGREYADVFQTPPPGLPPARGVEHRIELKPGPRPPPARPLRHQSAGDLDVIRKHIDEGVASGQLRLVLPEYSPPTMPVSALYLHNRHLSPKVRVFVDWAVELFSECPGLRSCENGDDVCHSGVTGGFHTLRAILEQNNKAETVF